MDFIPQVVVGTTTANKLKLNLDASHIVPTKKPFRFTPLAESILYKKPIIAFVTKKELGATRVANEDDVAALVNNAKHIQPSYLHSYLAKLSQIELLELELSFVLLPFDSDVKVAEELNNMLFFLEHAQGDSSSGKINYEVLEKKFSKLIKNKTIADFIPQARKHSFLKVLSTKGGRLDEAS